MIAQATVGNDVCTRIYTHTSCTHTDRIHTPTDTTSAAIQTDAYKHLHKLLMRIFIELLHKQIICSN